MKNGCHLVTFVSSLSRRFRLIARFPYAMKENMKNIKTLYCACLKQNKFVNVFFSPWLPGKSDLGEVLKWRKIKGPLKLRIWIKTVQVTFHVA